MHSLWKKCIVGKTHICTHIKFFPLYLSLSLLRVLSCIYRSSQTSPVIVGLGYGGSDSSIENGQTIPSSRIALDMEKAEWNPFRNTLDKSERKEFDDMFDIPRLSQLAPILCIWCPFALSLCRYYFTITKT